MVLTTRTLTDADHWTVNDLLYFSRGRPALPADAWVRPRPLQGVLLESDRTPIAVQTLSFEPIRLNGRTAVLCQVLKEAMVPGVTGKQVVAALYAAAGQAVRDQNAALMTTLSEPPAPWVPAARASAEYGATVRRAMPPFQRGWVHLVTPGVGGGAPPAWGDVRPMRTADAGAVIALYERRLGGLNGSCVRSGQDWADLWRRPDDRSFVIGEGTGLSGYLRLEPMAFPAGGGWRVGDLLETGPAAGHALWQVALALGTQAQGLWVPPLPPDRPWRRWLDGLPVTTWPAVGLIRPGAMQPFLAALAFASPAGSLVLGIVDPYRLWPRRVRITWENHALVECGETTAEPVAAMGVGALALLGPGLTPAPALWRQRLVDADLPTIARLAATWSAGPFFANWPNAGI
ncbi:MAG: sterol carrier protein domain-containing protein [Candidatus Sericytochromatia bacterium]|nr:sterol carrier protein domain-containing protein [Candidatus Sericytochromatia bacterium]